MGRNEGQTEHNHKGEVELDGIDKEEEEMEEDRNDILRREWNEGKDHTKRNLYCC